MSINKGLDKADVYRYTMEYHSAFKKNEIIPFAATWLDLEIIILSEVSLTKKNITYVKNLKNNDTNELIYKIEIANIQFYSISSQMLSSVPSIPTHPALPPLRFRLPGPVF